MRTNRAEWSGPPRLPFPRVRCGGAAAMRCGLGPCSATLATQQQESERTRGNGAGCAHQAIAALQLSGPIDRFA